MLDGLDVGLPACLLFFKLLLQLLNLKQVLCLDQLESGALPLIMGLDFRLKRYFLLIEVVDLILQLLLKPLCLGSLQAQLELLLLRLVLEAQDLSVQSADLLVKPIHFRWRLAQLQLRFCF